MALTRILSAVVLPTAALTFGLVMLYDHSASAVSVRAVPTGLLASPRPLERPFLSELARETAGPVQPVQPVEDTPIILPRETRRSTANVHPAALRVDGGIWTR